MQDAHKPFDLVDEMEWEDHAEFISLEEAGLEESSWQPIFGEGERDIPAGGVWAYCDWWADGENDQVTL
jgi:hypothetical protein